MVKPTAPIARIDAVTSPKPRLRTIWLNRWLLRWQCGRWQCGAGRPLLPRVLRQGLAHYPAVGGGVVGPLGVGPVGGVVPVEDHRPGCPDVLDRLACLES